MALVLYTQPRCGYCDVMKNMLDEIGYNYRVINIKEDKKDLTQVLPLFGYDVSQIIINIIFLNDKDKKHKNYIKQQAK